MNGKELAVLEEKFKSIKRYLCDIKGEIKEHNEKLDELSLGQTEMKVNLNNHLAHHNWINKFIIGTAIAICGIIFQLIFKII